MRKATLGVRWLVFLIMLCGSFMGSGACGDQSLEQAVKDAVGVQIGRAHV